MKRKSISPGLRFTVWRRDGFCCTYCGLDALTDGAVLEVDHVVPISAGGTNAEDNLTTACRPCNWRKGPHRLRVLVGWLVKITIQVTKDQLVRLDAGTPPHGSRADLIRRYVDQGLERDQRMSRIADALEPAEASA